jgi:hypothetical protein
MPSDISIELFKKTVDSLTAEAFSDVKGAYLDPKTSLAETLAPVSAEEASHPISGKGTTVAGHVAHIRFYLDVLKRYMENTLNEKIDWKQSWLVTSVSESEWDTLRQQLADDYRDIRAYLGEITDWNDEKRLDGALGIVAHTAFHLGAIRQILRAVRG